MDNLSVFKIEELHSKEPKIVLVHDYESETERSKWIQKLEKLDTFHMKSLYLEKNQSETDWEEFQQILDFKREGQIGFFPPDLQTKKSETKLKYLYKSIQVQNQKNFEPYQAGIYGIGGFISEHLDTYGTPDSPLETNLDFNSGMQTIQK